MDLTLNITTLACDARSYYDAYEVLQEQNESMKLSTPALLCLAFSLELHVKLLLRTYDLIERGHNIERLIKKLPEEEIAYISTHLNFHPTHQGQKFFENLVMASNLFVRTRYYFENMENLHFNTGFCITLGKIVRQRIVKRVPYLSYDLGFS